MTERGDKGSTPARLPAIVRMTRALEEAAQAVSTIENKYELTSAQKETLRGMLAKEVARRAVDAELKQVRLPDEAPELWGNRKGRKENPVAFIRRVYAPWLDDGLKRGDLRTLDQQLYQALAVWMHRHPDMEFAELGIEPSEPAEPQEMLRPVLAALGKRQRSAKPIKQK